MPTTSASATGYTGSSFSNRLLYDMNMARAHYGLPPMYQVYGMLYVSGRWTNHMEWYRLLNHNPLLVSQVSYHRPRWTVLGENVGDAYAQDPDSLFRAYWKSAPHRANILTRSFRYVGVTTAISGSTAWNTVDFVNAC